ncbi:MAG TPA: GNAT family N-acetyltransferase, partial [Oligoflexia bacterium]|nr:GNAT family N-acetyltransferase [Oligoflexia bacterium]HMP49889.1 GNAT family N-acetyltransferase [Oligoflexia bacterium]
EMMFEWKAYRVVEKDSGGQDTTDRRADIKAFVRRKDGAKTEQISIPNRGEVDQNGSGDVVSFKDKKTGIVISNAHITNSIPGGNRVETIIRDYIVKETNLQYAEKAADAIVDFLEDSIRDGTYERIFQYDNKFKEIYDHSSPYERILLLQLNRDVVDKLISFYDGIDHSMSNIFRGVINDLYLSERNPILKNIIAHELEVADLVASFGSSSRWDKNLAKFDSGVSVYGFYMDGSMVYCQEIGRNEVGGFSSAGELLYVSSKNDFDKFLQKYKKLDLVDFSVLDSSIDQMEVSDGFSEEIIYASMLIRALSSEILRPYFRGKEDICIRRLANDTGISETRIKNALYDLLRNDKSDLHGIFSETIDSRREVANRYIESRGELLMEFLENIEAEKDLRDSVKSIIKSPYIVQSFFALKDVFVRLVELDNTTPDQQNSIDEWYEEWMTSDEVIEDLTIVSHVFEEFYPSTSLNIEDFTETEIISLKTAIDSLCSEIYHSHATSFSELKKIPIREYLLQEEIDPFSVLMNDQSEGMPLLLAVSTRRILEKEFNADISEIPFASQLYIMSFLLSEPGLKEVMADSLKKHSGYETKILSAFVAMAENRGSGDIILTLCDELETSDLSHILTKYNQVYSVLCEVIGDGAARQEIELGFYDKRHAAQLFMKRANTILSHAYEYIKQDPESGLQRLMLELDTVSTAGLTLGVLYGNSLRRGDVLISELEGVGVTFAVESNDQIFDMEVLERISIYNSRNTYRSDELVEYAIKSYKNRAKDPDSRLYILRYQNEPVCFCIISEESDGSLSLNSVNTTPFAQSLGLMTPFLEHVIRSESRKLALPVRVSLYCEESNEGAVRLYRNLGFLRSEYDNGVTFGSGQNLDILNRWDRTINPAVLTPAGVE